MFLKRMLLPIILVLVTACAQLGDRVDLGRLEIGATVSFVRGESGEWGLEIADSETTLIKQSTPAQIEMFRDEHTVRQLAVGYQSIRKQSGEVIAQATVSSETGTTFEVEDRWTISGNVLSMSRNVVVSGSEDSTGFYSAIRFASQPTVGFTDVNCLAPGLLYGDPSYDGTSSPGGMLNYEAKRFSIREDLLSAPLFGISFCDGNWVAVLDLSPRGDTVMAETTASASTPVIDERIMFGALGARELSGGGVEFGFWLPGTTDEYSGGFRSAVATPVVRRRYHPVQEGFSQSYHVGFCFGKDSTFSEMSRDSWRWAWNTLDPQVIPVDIELVRRTLLDHLADRVLVVDDMAGIPFLFDAVTGNPGSYRGRSRPVTQSQRPPVEDTPAQVPIPNSMRQGFDTVALAEWAESVGVYLDSQANELILWPKIIMSFVCKGIESADQLLQEGDRDPGPRGQRMTELGMKIIDTYIRLVPMSPAPAGEGFNLQTGRADCRDAGIFTLRAPSEDMRILMDAYSREKKLGREHPEWLQWCRDLADWLLTQQREDGSFPRSWNVETHEVRDGEGTSSYNPVPLLVRLSEETGDIRYIDSAIRAAEYIWENYGSRGVFIGGATDNPNIVDKEAGMLSLEGYLSLYESTMDRKWLDRAIAAGDYAESWIWIWNVPMPMDADDTNLHWKKGVPTVGLQGITAAAVGAVDEYMAWSVPAYARLYKYTNDEHYLDVARILLHCTKSMLALPGRTYDLLGPGWQQEHWRMGPNNRGIGGHRSWLPWVSVNHLHGMTGLETLDPDLYQQLAEGN